MGVKPNPPTPDGGIYTAVQPLVATSQAWRLTIASGASATIDAGVSSVIPEGDYEILLDKSGGVLWYAWANTITIPATGTQSPASPNIVLAARDGEVIRAPSGGSRYFTAMLTGTNSGEIALVPLL